MKKYFIAVGILLFAIGLLVYAKTEEPFTRNTVVVVSEERTGYAITIHFTSMERYNEEVWLLAQLLVAEAENQSELGQRLAADSVINRWKQGYGDTIEDVIFARNQYECTINGRFEACLDDVTTTHLRIAKEELEEQINTEVLHFQTGSYHNFGTPLFKEGAHYFSK